MPAVQGEELLRLIRGFEQPFAVDERNEFIVPGLAMKTGSDIG